MKIKSIFAAVAALLAVSALPAQSKSKTLCEKRPDISELSYIAGHPPVAEYNEWYRKTHKE